MRIRTELQHHIRFQGLTTYKPNSQSSSLIITSYTSSFTFFFLSYHNINHNIDFVVYAEIFHNSITPVLIVTCYPHYFGSSQYRTLYPELIRFPILTILKHECPFSRILFYFSFARSTTYVPLSLRHCNSLASLSLFFLPSSPPSSLSSSPSLLYSCHCHLHISLSASSE